MFSGCESNIDLVFIMDQSESILENDPPETPYYNWNLFKDFVKTVVQSLPVGIDTRTAMIKYSTQSELVWNLNTYSDMYGVEVMEAVQGLQHKGGNTNTSGALHMARERVFRNMNLARDNVRKVILLMTDGLSTVQRQNTRTEAHETRSAGIEIYVVAIGKYIDEAEIREIATDIDTRIIHVTDFGRLQFIHDVLIHRLCNLPDPAPPTDTAPGKAASFDIQVNPIMSEVRYISKFTKAYLSP